MEPRIMRLDKKAVSRGRLQNYYCDRWGDFRRYVRPIPIPTPRQNINDARDHQSPPRSYATQLINAVPDPITRRISAIRINFSSLIKNNATIYLNVYKVNAMR